MNRHKDMKLVKIWLSESDLAKLLGGEDIKEIIEKTKKLGDIQW